MTVKDHGVEHPKAATLTCAAALAVIAIGVFGSTAPLAKGGGQHLGWCKFGHVCNCPVQ